MNSCCAFSIVHINSFSLWICGRSVIQLVANVGSYPVCQQRVSVKKESSLGDTVRLVIEFLRHHLIEIFQLLFLQDLGVKLCNTVYGIAGSDGQMSHFYLSVVDDCHFADLLLVARIFLPGSAQ